MEEKRKGMGESPMVFMDWPEIEMKENKIVLKSSITRVTITDNKVKQIKLPPERYENWGMKT